MRRQRIFSLFMIVALCAGLRAQEGSVARIVYIEGKAEVQRGGGERWRPARPNMPLRVGDGVYAHNESFVEIKYAIGAVLRLDENTRITITESSDSTIKTRNAVGDVFVNMRKLLSKSKRYEVSSPTAVASIRGTSFRMQTAKDSSTDVSVYDGTVAVGPSQDLSSKIKKETKQPLPDEPVEVPGPEEIPGPYEVSLEEWTTIVAGQRISVRADGKFATESFDVEMSKEDLFIKKCMERDAAQTPPPLPEE